MNHRTEHIHRCISGDIAKAGLSAADVAGAVDRPTEEIEDALAGKAPLYVRDLIVIAHMLNRPAWALLSNR